MEDPFTSKRPEPPYELVGAEILNQDKNIVKFKLTIRDGNGDLWTYKRGMFPFDWEERESVQAVQ